MIELTSMLVTENGEAFVLVSKFGMGVLRYRSPRVRLMMTRKVLNEVIEYRKTLRRWKPLLVKRIKR